MNSRVPSPCIRSTSSVSSACLLRNFSNKLLSAAAVALLGVASISSSQAADWLVENFEQYTTVPSSSNSTLSPQLNVSSNATTVIDSSGNKVLRYAKLTAAATGGSHTYSLSTPNFGTARTKGFVSFKVTANATPSAPVAASYFAFRLGANDINSVGSTNSAFVDVRMYQPTSTFGVKVYSNATQSGGNTTALPAGTNVIRVWFNSEATGMPYTDPSGNSQTLAAGTYVAYVNTTLINASASGSAMATSVTTATGVTSSAIGKIGFNVTSAQTADFSIDDIYAGDSAPVVTAPPSITSVASAIGYPSLAFSYSIIADQVITSYALASGTLPDGLTLNATTGVISGTPVATGGPTTVGLTATNTNGTSSAFSLSINIINPVNTYSGSNTSLNNGTWSIGAAPTTSASIGSFQDVTLASTATDLNTSSGNIYAKSWNVSNGSSYTVSSNSTTTTAFRMGNTGAGVDTTPFSNTVSGIQNDLAYLSGGSNLTFLGTNPTGGSTPSTVELRNSGNLNIGANSTLTLSAVITGSGKALTKTGVGTAVFSAANTYTGGTILTSGTLTLAGSAAPTVSARATAILTGGNVTGFTIVDGGSGYTVAPTVTLSKQTGEGTVTTATATATINGNGTVTAINVLAGGAGYTLNPQVQIFSSQSTLGTGAVTLSGGTLNATVDVDIGRTALYPDSTNTYFRTTGTTATINGPANINVADTKTVTAYTLAGNNNSENVITKSGNGTLWLRGGGAPTLQGGWNITGGTLFVGTSSSTALGTGKVSMNGGNLRFSKGISSTGTYTGHGQDLALEVLQDTTITLDANPLTVVGSNTASFTSLTVGNRTITLVKSPTASSSANSTANVTYTDPSLNFSSGNLTSNATFNTGALTQLSLVSIAGPGGLTKTGTGRLLLGSGDVSITSNSYTGATVISEGTLALAGNHTSAITLTGNTTVLELNLARPVVSTAALTFSSNASVSIVGTPASNTTYDLVTASAITGTPALSPSIIGFTLVNTGTVLQLAPAAIAPTITSASTATGFAGVPFSYQIVALNATSFAQTAGTLPAGLTLNTTTGEISGTPTTIADATAVTLTATGAGGTGAEFSLEITIADPLNTFSGSNPSLNNSASWSLGQTPTASGNTLGSFQDITLAASVTNLTTSSGSIFAKSWNVTNGGNYSVSSTSSTTTAFHLGNTGNSSITTFNNSVSGVQNDLVYLSGNSSLTLAPTNSTANSTASTVELRNSGNLNIGTNSTLTLSAVITGSGKALTKTGNGTVVLGAANTYTGGTTLGSGTLTLSGSASPTTLARATAAISGGSVTSVSVVGSGSGYTAAPAVSFIKGSGDTTGTGATATATINSSGEVTAITIGNAGTGYTVPPLVYVYSTQSPLGTGAVTLSGGTLNATVDADLSRMTDYAAGNATYTFYRTTSANTLTINGTVTIDVADSKTVSASTIVGGNNTSQVITKSGNGTLWLRGSGAATIKGDWNVTGGTLFIGTVSSSALGTGKVSMNGGNLRFSKGISSSGTYTGHGQDLALEVLQDTTITLDANPLSIVGNNTASFNDFTIGNRTITLVKSSTAISSANSTANVTYSDPAFNLLSGNLTGNATFNTGALTQLSLVSIAGSGGLTKTGPGRLLLGSGNTSITSNSYTGATAISAGTLTLAGNHTSAITLGNGTILELDLVAPVVSTAELTFSGNASVKIIGTPAGNTSYDLVTASAITGNATLSPSITGFLLVKTGDSTVLRLSPDTTAPVIIRAGNATVTVNVGANYTDAGASVTDNLDSGVTVTTTITPGGSVDTAAPGVYTVTYNATDAAGNAATPVTREVTVVSADSIAPVITRTGSATASVAWGSSYTDAGATATDNVDPSVTVTTTGTVNTATPGAYTITYNATDAAGNVATPVTRTVTVAIANPTTVGADGLTPLMKYALGANSPTDSVQAPVVSNTSNTLSLTAVVRTDDPKLTVIGKTNTDLTLSANWTTTGVSGSPAGAGTTGNQTGVTGSLVRKVYTVTTGSKTFLRLEATLTP